MAGEYITINAKNGATFRAYLSLPPRGKGPGIVLCHEMYGANQTMRDVADIYACEGYVVAVPDLYWRTEAGLEFDYTSGDWQRAYALSQSFDYERGLDDVQATLAALQARGDVHSETTASVAARQLAQAEGKADGAGAAAGPSGDEDSPDARDAHDTQNATSDTSDTSSTAGADTGAATVVAKVMASVSPHAPETPGAAVLTDEHPVGPISHQPPSGIAVVGFAMGGKLAYLAGCRLRDVGCAVSYYGSGIDTMLDEAATLSGRLVLHLAENDKLVNKDVQSRIASRFDGSKNVEVYIYPGAEQGFSRRGSETYNRPLSTVAHQRTMAAVKREMGPYFNLSRLWDAHRRHCFVEPDVDAIMAGMVDDPYINHVPTQTGADGAVKARQFYERHVIGSLPADARQINISRTVGASQLVDEILFCFTHSCTVDWMLPGVAPTNRYVEIPMVAIVNFRGEKIFRQQIYWDQASLLVQIGHLEASALPIAGIECARKLVNDDLPSNGLIERAAASDAASR
jgi:carboxymethylenebutenolidase